MGNVIKFVILAGALGCYAWYLSSMQATVNGELSQLSNVYAHADEIASQSSR